MKRALLAIGLFVAWPSLGAEAPLVLQNQQLALRFNPRTGNWIGLTLRLTGEELVHSSSPLAGVAPAGSFKLNPPRLDQALGQKDGVSLAGVWLYTPTPPSAVQWTAFLQGLFSPENWAPTPVPSRRGTGDDRLHNRTGDYCYRREFAVPLAWLNQELALIIGAVDDFDSTYINGQPIGHTGTETPHHWETPRFYRFSGSLLGAGTTNTILVKVTNGAFDGGLDGPIVLGLASALQSPEANPPPLTSHALFREQGSTKISLVAANPGLEYKMDFALPDDQAAFSRQLSVKNLSSQEQVFETARYHTPAFSLGTNQSVVFPGSLPWGDLPLAALQAGDPVRPRTEDPLVILWDSARRQGLGSWFHCEEEFAPVSVRRNGAGVEIQHSQGIVVRLQPGEAVTLGKQYFWLAMGSRDSVLRGVQAVYRSIGLVAPTNRLPRLAQMVLYCGHPGGPPELDYLRYGGFRALERYVPTLRRLNIDLLWLLPTWEHGDGTKWNLYSPFDHFQVDHLLGSVGDLKALSCACATNRIRLLFDLVPHGPPDFTPLAREHPDWVARTPDGQHQVAWSQLAFDNHHPEWQAYMRRAAAWGAREFAAVGARVDCGAGGPLNWNRAVSSRPSLSSLAGGLGMNQAIRDGYLQVHGTAVVLPEEYTGANIFNRVGDLTYDAQFYFLQADLLDRQAPPEEWARAFQRFLHDQQQTLPPGTLKMRWISNHDTVSWTFQKQRPAKAYGLDRMRALLALCTFIEGVPMLYQGDEDPAAYGGRGESSIEFLARLYALRKRLGALREGVADYASVQATGGVFACRRGQGPETALVLISFNPANTDTRLSLPAECLGEYVDRLSTQVVSLQPPARLTMAPFQVRVLSPLPSR
jgi:hypothetical protein